MWSANQSILQVRGALAAQDPYQFQWWALGLVGARPVEQKKGADKGIDGRLFFHDDAESQKTKQIVLSVKSGSVQVAHVRDLRGVVEREKAAIGVLIALEEPTRNMKAEAAGAGFYESPWQTKHPKDPNPHHRGLAGRQEDRPPAVARPENLQESAKGKEKRPRAVGNHVPVLIEVGLICPIHFKELITAAEGRFAIVVSRFNESITSRLLEGAVQTLTAHGVADERIDVAWTPGAFEIPTVANRLAASGRYVAVICLGAVIRGETTHDQHINRAVSTALCEIGVHYGLPVLFGILTCNTLGASRRPLGRPGCHDGQGPARCQARQQGRRLRQAALEMVDLHGKLPDEAVDDRRCSSGELVTPSATRRPGRPAESPASGTCPSATAWLCRACTSTCTIPWRRNWRKASLRRKTARPRRR